VKDLNALQDRLNYKFKDLNLLENALRHRSVPGLSNERLEFLGDAILGHIMADALYAAHPKACEGDLSRMRSSLVKGDQIAELGKALNLSDYIYLGAGEQKSGGQYRNSILADVFEAIIGAIYLDRGFEACQTCVLKWYSESMECLSTFKPEKDPKSALQEWLQAHKLPLPTYVAKTSGKAHAQTFYVTCQVEGLKQVAKGVSMSLRKAEQAAAREFLDLMHE